MTRRNDRRPLAGRNWVKNGDRWRILLDFADGALAVRRIRRDGRDGGTVALPASYVAQHVELGYATTIHSAQGPTVDTAHAASDTDTAARELLSVAMTCGADANHVYVTTQSPVDDHVPHGPARSANERLASVLARVGAEPPATDTLHLAIREHTSLPMLIHEYETIAAHAVSIGVARWPQHDGRRRTRIAGLITIPGGNLPTDYALALEERERAILEAAREAVQAAVHAGEPWTRATPSRMLEATALYRAKYAVTDLLALGTPPDGSDRARALDHQLVRRAGAIASLGDSERNVTATPSRGGLVRWLEARTALVTTPAPVRRRGVVRSLRRRRACPPRCR